MHASTSRRLRVALAAAGLLGLAALLLFVGLDAYPLWDPDEGRHSLIARTVWTATDWRSLLLPRLHDRPYHDKPILYYWLTASAFALGGPTTFAARWVSASCALATVALVFWFALRAWGLAAAVAAGTMLLTAVGFLGLGRFSSLDMLLAVAVTAALVALHPWIDDHTRRRPLGVASAAVGVGLLAKGAVAAVLVAGIGMAHLALTGRVRRPCGRTLLVAAIPCLLVAGPWYLLVGWLDPAYLSEFLLRHHVQRFLAASARLHPAPFWYTPMAALALFWPWSVLLPAVVRDARERGLDDARRFCVTWAVAVVAFFTFSSGKLVTYVLPAMPALALLCGPVVSAAARELVTEPTRRLVRRGVVVASATWVAAAVALLAAGFLGSTTPLLQRAGLALASLATARALSQLARRASLGVGVGAVAAAVMATAGAFYGVVVPGLEARFSDARLARLIRESDPQATGPLLVWGDPPASMAFYLDRPAHTIARPRALRRVLARRDRVFVVAGLGQVDDLQRMTGHALEVIAAGRHVLLAARPAGKGTAARRAPMPPIDGGRYARRRFGWTPPMWPMNGGWML